MQRASLILFVVLTITLNHASAKMYRWVDEEGNVHYSDKIPASQVKQARDEISGQGVRMGSTPRAKTVEEFEREKELERLRAERQRLIEEQKATDRVLLRTFRSEDDLLLVRNGKLAAIDVMIQVTQGNIRRHQAKLAQLQSSAANQERAGRNVAANLLASIDSTLRNINEGYGLIDRKELEKQAIRDKFAVDLKRFRTLKNIQPKFEEEAAEAPQRELQNLLRCPDQERCDQAWERAEAFVRRHATTRIQMIGANIVMTAAPLQNKDVSITISRLNRQGSGDTLLFMDLFCKDTPRGREFCASQRVQEIRKGFRTEVGAE